MYIRLFSLYTPLRLSAPFFVHSAVFNVYKALFNVYKALFNVYKALFNIYTALFIVHTTAPERPIFCVVIYIPVIINFHTNVSRPITKQNTHSYFQKILFLRKTKTIVKGYALSQKTSPKEECVSESLLHKP